MRALKQTGPDDCFRTAIACLLDCERPDDVPHFMEDRENLGDAYSRLRKWLAGRGLAYAFFGVHGDIGSPADAREVVAFNNPDLYYVMIGTNSRGENHATVCCGRYEIHDPAWAGSGLQGPGNNGNEHYGILVLVPLGQVSD